MRASREVRLTQAFVITPEEFRRLISTLQRRLPEIAVTAGCADGLERSFERADDFLDYENTKKKGILFLRIRASTKNFAQVCALRLDNNEIRNIYISIDADEDIVLELSEQIEDRLSSMRPWYFRMASVNAIWWLFNIPFILFSVVIPAMKAWLNGNSYFSGNWNLPAVAYLIFVVSGLLFAGALFWFDRLRHLWFPMGVFSIGQGAKMHHDRDIFRTTVIVGFLISVFASLAISPFI